MITDRDKQAIDFIYSMGAATTSQIQRAVYSGGKYADITARRRLKHLEACGLVKRTRGEGKMPYAEEYIYWISGAAPRQTDHMLTLTEFYVRLAGLPGKIETWEREPSWPGLRPDAYCEVSRGPLVYMFAIEVQRITGNPFDQGKYEAYYASGEWRQRWPQFPRVLVITDKPLKLKTTNIMFIPIPSSMGGIETIF